MKEPLTSARECADAILSGEGFAVMPKGLCGRILRGTSDKAFETLTDDPDRLLVMTMGPDGLASLVGMSGYDMLIEIGYEPDYIVRKLEEGNRFKLLVFKGGPAVRRAGWEEVVDEVAEIYAEVGDKIWRVLDGLMNTSFDEIQKQAGYSFAEVDKNGPSDPRFMTFERLMQCSGLLWEVRAFLYHTVYLRELYTGDGWTYTGDGERGVAEYIAPNVSISEFEDAVLVDLDVRLPPMVALRREVAKLHDLPDQLYILHTGSAGPLVQELWLTPGSSATILGAHFCYAQEVLQEDVGNEELVMTGASFCSEPTAKLMAEVAWRKARRIAGFRLKGDAPIIGLGITSVVCSKENLPEGKLECANIAIKTQDGTFCVFVKLTEADATASMSERIAHRKRQGELIDLVALNLLLWAVDGVSRVRLDPEWLQHMSSDQFTERANGDVVVEPKARAVALNSPRESCFVRNTTTGTVRIERGPGFPALPRIITLQDHEEFVSSTDEL